MKHLNLLKSKYAQWIIFLSIASLLIWFATPYLVIAHHAPFQDITQRLYLIAVICLSWSLKICIFDIPHSPQTMRIFSPEQFKKLQILQSRFKGAIQFLKHNSIQKQGKNIYLFELPWFLVIGPENAGKTTLLANSSVNFVLAKQFDKNTLKQLNPSDDCDWWVTRDLVLIDVPSYFIFGGKKEKSATTRYLWKCILDLIQKYRGKTPLNGVIIALNLPELFKPDNQPNKESVISSITQTLLQIQNKYGQGIPVFLTVTKCDLIPGFIEFFGDSGSDELAQTFGITIPPLKQNEKFADVFIQRFNTLIKRLNKQLLWRLHQERTSHNRPQIKDFPLQVERIKDAILNLIKAIQIPNLNLQGIYLTSAIQASQQPEKNADNPNTHYQQNQIAMQLFYPSSLPSRPFFIKQFILQGLLNTFSSSYTSPPAISWQKRITYTTAILVITFSCLILGRDFQQSVQQAYSLQQLLNQYQIALSQDPTEIDHLAKALPLLDALQNASKTSKANLADFNNIITFYTKKSQKTAEQIYHQALQTLVIPEIKHSLENYLQQNNTDKNPIKLYGALKAYLMLGNMQRSQIDFAADALMQILSLRLNDHQSAKLATHLKIALSELQPLQLNTNLIAEIRKSLLTLPRTQLAFVILKSSNNNNLNSDINLGANLGKFPVFLTKIDNKIPNMYTGSYFQAILTRDLPIAASEALHGNTILGEIQARLMPAEEAELRQDLEKQYVSNYTDIWESLLANIQLNVPHSLAETNLLLAQLTSDTSPLIQLLQTLQQNTMAAPILNVSPKLQATNKLLADSNNPDNNLYQLFTGIKELKKYVWNMLQPSPTNEAAFNAAKLHMSGLNQDAITHLKIIAEKTPDPIQSWLYILADTTWHTVLNEASRTIQLHWKAAIASNYNDITNRFPLQANAHDEADLNQFIDFFNPQGVLIHFYETNLKPFTDDSAKEWQWKHFDNEKLPFSNEILQKIQYAIQFQRAIFPNGDNKLYIPFTLQPIALGSETQHINFNINGQLMSYEKLAPLSPRVLTWPGNNGVHSTTINLTTNDSHTLEQIYQGDWAWLRLVNHSTQSFDSPKELSLKFIVNNHTAKYKLYSQGQFNPFMPSNWEKLQLPNELG